MQITKRIVPYLFFMALFINSSCYKNIKQDTFNIIITDSVIYADGFSTTNITGVFDNEIPKEQKITFTTSQGKLFKIPISPSSTGEESITFSPMTKEFRVVLQSDRTPNQKVLVSLEVNGFVQTQELAFVTSCPEEIYLSPDREVLSDQLNETMELHVVLFNSERKISKGIKADFVCQPLELTNVDCPRLSNNSVVTNDSSFLIIVTPTDRSRGDYQIIGSVQTQSCEVIKDTVFVTITD